VEVGGRADRRLAHRAVDPPRDGQEAAADSRLIDESIELAERIVEQAETGRVDLGELGRRARRVLEATARPAEPDQLF
jgi:hypothetical protein